MDGEPAAKKRVIYTDHDYIAHKSPGSEHSDSGISGVSDDSTSSLHQHINCEDNMTDDQLEFFVTSSNGKNSPEITSSASLSPHSLSGESQTFDLFNVTDQTEDIKVESAQLTHTVDTTTADLEDFDFTTCSSVNDENVSIDFGKLPYKARS